MRLGKGSFQNIGWPYEPTTSTSVQLSLYDVAAIMLLENDVFVDQCTAEKIRAPWERDMMQKIHILHDPTMDGMEAAEGNPVEITLKDRTVLSAWGRGLHSMQRPTTQADGLQTFRKMTAARLSTTAQDARIALCARLETAEAAPVLVAMRHRGGNTLGHWCESYPLSGPVDRGAYTAFQGPLWTKFQRLSNAAIDVTGRAIATL
jgi:2-methylcitrate dehydratase PrpD